MRSAIAMIELIFAIVIIAISVMTIPSMMNVSENISKGILIDEDIMSRMSGWNIEKFQARWDDDYTASDSGPLWPASGSELNCSRGSGNVWYRANSYSNQQCNELNTTISTFGAGDGNLTKGIEQLNDGWEILTITPSVGNSYDVNASYSVDYVNSAIVGSGTTYSAQWVLGSSSEMDPDTVTTSHLKRIVTKFYDADLGLDITMSFFKSNKGN